MLTFILKRLLQAIPVLWVIATATFFMIRLTPGGPFHQERPLPPQVLEAIEKHYGLRDPLWTQYTRYLKNLIQGDLGPSYAHPGYNVTSLIKQSFPISIELGLYAWILALFIGIPIGVWAAAHQNQLFDKMATILSTVGLCIPTFVLGPILILILALHLGIGNVCGWHTIEDRLLPVLTLGLVHCAYIIRLTRNGMLETLNQEFIRTAYSKGLSTHTVLFKHALKSGLTSVIAFTGPQLSALITGSFVIETIFHIPGLGRHFVQGAFNRDYTLILGTTLLYGVIIVIMNLGADLLQAWMNPKLRKTLF
jgi:oligopeptide transport system permease protein